MEEKQQREKKAAGICKVLGCSTASNCLPSCSTTTPRCFSSLTASVLQPRIKEIFSPLGWAVNHLHPQCWQTGAPQQRQTGLCKGELDHRLAILGSTHQPGTFFNFITLNSRALQRGRGTVLSLVCFQTKFSDHDLPTHFPTSSILQRHSDKRILPVTSHRATNSDPSKSKAAVTLVQPPAPGLLGEGKAEPTTLSNSELLKGLLQHD